MRSLPSPWTCGSQPAVQFWNPLSSGARWLAKWIGLAALTATVPATGATRYIFSTFKGDAAESEKLSIYTSTDGLNFTLLSNTGYAGPTGVLRDPSIMKHSDGQYYVAYTLQSWTTTSSSFAIAKSSNLTSWTFVVEVPSQVSGVKNTWAPEWFKDSDGSIHLIVSINTASSDFKPYLFTATNDALSQWSAPQELGIGTNHIDTFVVNVSGTYHAFCKDEASKYIEHATASKLLGPWTFSGVGDWAGWGSGKEGPALFQLDNGDWRMFMDCYSGCGYLYTTSTDLVTWSATSTVPSGLTGVRHGTVLREQSGTGGAVSTGGAGNTGGASVINAGGTKATGGASGVGGTKVAVGGMSATSSGGTKATGGAGGTTGGTFPTGGINGTGGAASTVPVAGGSSAVATGGASSKSTGTAVTGGNSAASGGNTSSSSVAGGTNSSGGTANASSSSRAGGTASSGGAIASGGVTSALDTATGTSSGAGTSGRTTGGVTTEISTAASSGGGAASSGSQSGCNCSVPRANTNAAWCWSLLAVVGFVRRRRATRQR